MARYKVSVPPTNDVGSYSTIVSGSFGQTKEQEALADYNSAKDHDGLRPLKRMPNGTRYTKIR